MNLSNCRLFIFSLGLMVSAISVWAAATKPARPGSTDSTKGVVQFTRTKTRINALLSPRLKPEPLPETLPNPFQVAEVAPPPAPVQENDPKPAEGLAPGSDSEMLVYYGATLRISGTVKQNGQTHLVINQAPYKEGDIFALKTKDVVANLRIIKIAPGELTLGLNDAVQVVKFKK